MFSLSDYVLPAPATNKRFWYPAPDIHVWTPSIILKLLRNFGHVISNIYYSVHSESWDKFTPHTENYMAEYCSKTLTQLELYRRPQFLFDAPHTQFGNVKSLILHITSPPIIHEIQFIFPNMQYLSLNLFENHSTLDITIGFPSLKNLEIRMHVKFDPKANEIVKLVQLSPQLEKLLLWDLLPLNFEFIQCIRDCLPKLKYFYLRFGKCTDNVETFHLENTVDFSINSYRELKYIPFTFGKLERFHIQCKMTPCIAEFIAKNKHLKKLHLEGNIYDSEYSLLDLRLSNIEDLTINVYLIHFITSDTILRFLRECRSLKRFTLIISRDYSHLEFERYFSDAVKSKISKQTTIKPYGQWSFNTIGHITFTP